MSPLGVVERYDVVVDVFYRLQVVGVASVPEPLYFQVEEKPLHHGIVPTVALAAHALDKAVFFQ